MLVDDHDGLKDLITLFNLEIYCTLGYIRIIFLAKYFNNKYIIFAFNIF